MYEIFRQNIATLTCQIKTIDRLMHRQLFGKENNSPPLLYAFLFDFLKISPLWCAFLFHFIFITFEINWGRLSSHVISVVASQYNWIDGRHRLHFETLPWVTHRLDFSQFNLEIPIQLTFSNFQITAFYPKRDSFMVDNEKLSWPVSSCLLTGAPSKIIFDYIL